MTTLNNTTATNNVLNTQEEITMKPTTLSTMIADDFGGLESPVITIGGAEYNPDDLLNFDFTSSEELSDVSLSNLNLERKLAVQKFQKNVLSDIYKAFSLVRSFKLLEGMGEFAELRGYVLRAIIEATYYWSSKDKTNPKQTQGDRIYSNLLKVDGVTKESNIAKLFQHYVGITKQYTLDEDKASETVTYLPEHNSNIRVAINRSGISVTADAGTELVPTNGTTRPFIFKRKVVGVFGIETFNEHLTNVLRNIRIHNEFVVQAQNHTSVDTVELRKDALRFRKADVLGLLLLLKMNRIDTKELFESQRKGTNQGLALRRKLNSDKLERIYVPSHTFPEVYRETGVVSLSQARQGYFSPMVSLPLLVEYYNTKDSEGNDVKQALFREAVNKTLNRIDKLHDKDGWKTKAVRFLVVVDATESKIINQALLTGAIFMPNWWLEKYGVCRVVTEMLEGGVKSATTAVTELDPILDQKGIGIISPSAWKGGLLAAFKYATNKELKNLIPFDEKDPEKSNRALAALLHTVMSSLKTYIVNGEEIRGFEVELELTITNAYTVESVMLNDGVPSEDDEINYLAHPDLLKNLDNLQEELETGRRSVNGLRDIIMNRTITEPGFKVNEWLNEGLNNQTLRFKPALTRIIAPEIQSIARWYGKKEAATYLKTLLNRQAKFGMDVNKIIAAQWITGNTAITRTVRASLIAEKLIESVDKYKLALRDNSPVYPMEVIEDLYNNHFKPEGCNAIDWVGIKFPNGEVVPMPLGQIFDNNIEEEFSNPSNIVVVKGLFAELLENIKTGITQQEYVPTSISHLLLAAQVQKPLLGKNFGYQYTRGMYGVMLPLLNTKHLDNIALTRRERISKSDSDYVKMNGSKAPQYFIGSTAGYRVYNKEFNREGFDNLFACAIFITPDATMILQNDHDGDLFRISKDGHTLPMFKGPFKEFNSKFFTDFLADEKAGNKMGAKPAANVTLEVMHKELFDAVEAKNKVGLYTANKYFYEVAFDNVSEFVGTDGATYSIDTYDKHVITAILAQLIQVEAMNNIKQDGAKEFFTEIVLAWKLAGIKAFGTQSKEERVDAVLKSAMDGLTSINDKYSMGLTPTRIKTYVQAIYHTANTYNRDNMLAYAMMNKRVIEERNVVDITNSYNVEGYEYKGTYNFYNSYDRIVNCADTQSMYHDIVTMTIAVVFGEEESVEGEE